MPTSSPTTNDSFCTLIFYTYVKNNEHACKVIVNSDSCRVGLSTISHLAPYDVSWIDVTTLPVHRQCQVPLRVSTYDEHILCDVLSMKIGGIIFGQPWLFDYDVQLMGRANTYGSPTCFALVLDMRDDTTLTLPSLKVKGMLSKYADVLLEELPRELPPLRHIQHAIDLVLEVSLLNLLHYHMELPAKYEELNRQVQELLNKGFIQLSLSLYVVLALLVSKKDDTWRMCYDSRTINKIIVNIIFRSHNYKTYST
ncbi:unnamed protein product [Spirodela intermedia]|uniref:Uncharacterized protein n=1 Tax=Spirodela intermedia TaxID=51605 RepID=A0A7I8I8S4_SPIIN|nr:unnamed protein product [Spirodela intermedia]CAA6654055.1 unnamed protein product [Spirodela intermedia]